MDSGLPLPGTYVPYGGPVTLRDDPSPANFANILGASITIRERVYWKHPEHWYEDGNFGFLVESAAFRLHGSILSRRSQVMEDLLSLPQPTSSNPSNNNDDIVVDGVPFITLHDKAQDFANVLNFIYNQSLPGAPAPYLNRQDLMGIIRFTGKYLMDSLRQWAVLQLEQVHLVLARDISSKSGLTHVIALQSREEHIRTIDFARECSLPQYLPLSFYALATQDGAGHRAPEGYRPSCGPPSPWPPLPHQTWGPPLPNQGWGLPPPPWLQPPSGPHPGPPSADIQLSQEDQRRVDEGRVALTKAVIQKAFGRQENLGSEERCAGSCRNGLPTMWQDAATRWEQLLLHPLEELDARSKIDYEHLCEECAYWVKVSSGTLRDELVKQLVIFFKLEDEVGSADDNDSYRGHDEYGPYDSDG